MGRRLAITGDARPTLAPTFCGAVFRSLSVLPPSLPARWPFLGSDGRFWCRVRTGSERRLHLRHNALGPARAVLGHRARRRVGGATDDPLPAVARRCPPLPGTCPRHAHRARSSSVAHAGCCPHTHRGSCLPARAQTLTHTAGALPTLVLNTCRCGPWVQIVRDAEQVIGLASR